MKEAAGEKRIRYLLVGFVVVGVIIAFYYQTLKFINPTPTSELATENFEQMAAVIKPMTESEDPLVAIVKIHEQTPLLLLYNINVADRYKFENVHTVQLKQPPEAIESVQSKGIWLKLEGDWHFFDTKLHSRPKESNETVIMKPSVNFKQIDGQTVVLSTNGNELWTEKFPEPPLSIHSLSSDHSVWLIIFENDIVIYEK